MAGVARYHRLVTAIFIALVLVLLLFGRATSKEGPIGRITCNE